jgi:lipid-A-disaccharide synthase
VSRSLLVVAGEVSGDMHAGTLLEELRRREPALEVFGAGGDRMASAGAELLVHIRDLAVFGPFAAIVRYPHFRRVFRRLESEARRRRPDAAMLVDYGGFNLRFAAALKRLGIKVVYYISPQVWASRPWRIRTMARVADRLMVIFPFEPEAYQGTGLRVDFVGHPLVDAVEQHVSTPETALPWEGRPRIALLPGSRRQEVDAILPVLLQSAHRIAHLKPESSFLVAAPNRDLQAHVRRRLDRATFRVPRLQVVADRTREVVRQARAAVVASGTATLEAALLECPMVIVYRTSPLLFFLGKHLVRVPHIGMANLIAGRELCPEFVQRNATGSAVATALFPLLDDTPARQDMLAGLREVRTRLGPQGAVRRAADLVQSELCLDL